MVDQIHNWLTSLGLTKYAEVFTDNEIDCSVLPHLGEDDLRELGLPLGPRKKLLAAIANLDAPEAAQVATNTPSRDAERRQLTVMFVDLVGSTELSARLDPETLREVIRAYQTGCAEAVSRFEGYIAKYIGDGLLVYFGYPQAHEDDARRAVSAALAIVDSLGQLNQRLAKEPGIELSVRVGIHTGLVVVGEMGGGETREPDAIVGETPNVAARIEGVAKPNTVAISAATHALVEGLFESKDLGPQRLKGISNAISVYSVQGESNVTSRFEATAKRGLSPLVGREAEIDLLLNRWAQAKDGEGQLLLLTGEAGIGKSRLARGLMDKIAAEPHIRLRYQCSPYHSNTALYPFISQLEFAAGFSDRDDVETKTSKLKRLLDEAGRRGSDSLPLLSSLLSFTQREEAQSPHQRKQNTFDALLNQLIGLATRQPIFLLFEDAHWSDPTSSELLEQMIEAIRDQRIFALITARPEFEPRWPNHFHITKLMLNRLGRKQITEIVNGLSGGKTISKEVLGQIVSKTDGVPLFVEELTKTILESESLQEAGGPYVPGDGSPSLTIPSTLQDSLMARLDRLAVVRDVAQIGSAIGREFSYQLIAGVASLESEELQKALDQLVESELVYRRGMSSTATYVFKHALVRDIAYGTLLRERRVTVHQRIASYLRRNFSDRVYAQPEVLAHHLTEGGDIAAAIPFWISAGKIAVERIADTEAAEHFKKALSLLETQPDNAENRGKELEIQVLLASSVMNNKGAGADEVRNAYMRARDLCSESDDPSLTFQVIWGLWINSVASGLLAAGLRYAQEAIALAKSTNNLDQLLQAHHAAWTSEQGIGQFEAARQHAVTGVGLYDLNKHRDHAFLYGGHDPGICAGLHAAYASWFVGRPKEADTHVQWTLHLAREVAHPFSTALAITYVAQLLVLQREPDRAVPHVEELLSHCDEYNLPLWRANGIVLKHWAASDTGVVSLDDLEEFHKAIQKRLTMGAQLRIPLQMAALARGFAQAGKIAEALILVDQAQAQMEQSGERTWETYIHWARGEILASGGQDDQEASASAYRRAIEASRLQGAKIMELRSLTSLGRCKSSESDLGGIRSELKDLLAHFSATPESPDVRDAANLLQSVSRKHSRDT